MRWNALRRALLLGGVLVAFFAGLPATSTPARAVLAPELQFLLKRAQADALSQAALDALGGLPADAAIRVGVLVRTTAPEALVSRGLALGSVAGDVVSARVTLAQLRQMRSWPEVVYVEGPGALSLTGAPAFPELPRLWPELSESVRETGALGLHGRGVTGKGVVIGVIDTGVDWTHLDFRVDRTGDGIEEGSRLLSIWDQTTPGVRPQGFDYGVEYTRQDIGEALVMGNEDNVREFDANPNAPSHGTLALGIAGGDGSSSDRGLVGMAPEAELIAVKSPLTFDTILDGVVYVFNTAGQRPAVASLSLGSHLGAHDGTSNFERALEALVQVPGRAIVVAAGNEGDDRIHVGGQLNALGTTEAVFDIPDGQEGSRFSFNFWYGGDPQVKLRFSVVSPNGQRVGPVSTGEVLDRSTSDGGVFIDNAQQGPNPNNGMNEVLVTVYGKLFGAQNALTRGRWEIELDSRGLATRYDGWALSVPFTSSNADSRYTIRLPATAEGLIAVGAYVVSTSWPSASGRVERFEEDNGVGQLAKFSSQGPTRDGRLKPDIVAPGSMVASSLSKFSTNLVEFSRVLSDGVHAVARGTSFAAPHVAGAVALLLQQAPQLTAAELRQRLNEGALRDGFTGPFPSMAWGHGKLELGSRQANPNAALLVALDRNGNDALDDLEVVTAVQAWVSGGVLSGATGVNIGDETIVWLITLWVEQADLQPLKSPK